MRLNYKAFKETFEMAPIELLPKEKLDMFGKEYEYVYYDQLFNEFAIVTKSIAGLFIKGPTVYGEFSRRSKRFIYICDL